MKGVSTAYDVDVDEYEFLRRRNRSHESSVVEEGEHDGGGKTLTVDWQIPSSPRQALRSPDSPDPPSHPLLAFLVVQLPLDGWVWRAAMAGPTRTRTSAPSATWLPSSMSVVESLPTSEQEEAVESERMGSRRQPTKGVIFAVWQPARLS